MTLFEATEIIKNNATNGQQFNSTFKIKGQIYQKMVSLLLIPNESPKTGCIKLSIDFYTIIHSQDDLIDQIFLDVRRQYTNNEWLAERAILAAKNVSTFSAAKIALKIQQIALKNKLLLRYNICWRDTLCHKNLSIQFAMPTKLLIIQQRF